LKKLGWEQRRAIYYGIQEGKSNAQIAREIGVHRSTVGREIERNADSRETYHPQEADDMSWRRQQMATTHRMIVHYGGVDYLSTLQKHGRVYVYYSETHFCEHAPFSIYHSWAALFTTYDSSHGPAYYDIFRGNQSAFLLEKIRSGKIDVKKLWRALYIKKSKIKDTSDLSTKSKEASSPSEKVIHTTVEKDNDRTDYPQLKLLAVCRIGNWSNGLQSVQFIGILSSYQPEVLKNSA
jgi:hypothetical protein